MKILLVAYHFPPDRAVGALRPGRLARILAERGHEVRVLAGPRPTDEQADCVGDATVERLSPWLDLRAMYARLKGRFRKGRKQQAGGSEIASWVPEHTSAWKRHFVALLWLPDDRQGWMMAAVRRGRAALGPDGFDVLYTTGPPFSAHLAGLLLRRSAPNSRWIAEFRDPWTDSPFKPASGRTRWSDAAERRMERAVLNTADRVICVSESAGALLAERLGPSGSKVAVVRNGIEKLDSLPLPAGQGNGRILYAGNLYHSRDPMPFLGGLAALDAAGHLPAAAGVDFVGDCSHFNGIDVREFAADAGISHRVTVRDAVPHDVSLRMMREASALLLLAQNQPLQIPNKLYEYLGARRPILAFCDANGETAAMLSRLPTHVALDSSDPAEIGRAIRTVLTRNPEPDPGVDRVLEEWRTDRQYARLVEIIESIRNP